MNAPQEQGASTHTDQTRQHTKTEYPVQAWPHLIHPRSPESPDVVPVAFLKTSQYPATLMLGLESDEQMIELCALSADHPYDGLTDIFDLDQVLKLPLSAQTAAAVRSVMKLSNLREPGGGDHLLETLRALSEPGVTEELEAKLFGPASASGGQASGG